MWIIDRKGVSIPSVTLASFNFARAMASLSWSHGSTFSSKVFRWFFVMYLMRLLPWATLAWCGPGCATRSSGVNDSLACTNGGSAILSFQNRQVEMKRQFSLILDRTL